VYLQELKRDGVIKEIRKNDTLLYTRD